MERLDKMTRKFQGYEGRSENFGIYRKDRIVSEVHPHDTHKVLFGIKKIQKGSGKQPLLDFGKQLKRDSTQVVRATVGEAYDNIRRENEKADFIKKLLA